MLSLSKFLVKEHVSFLRLTDTFDILNPETGAKIGEAKENISILLKLLRLGVNKTLLPTHIDITESNGSPVFSMKRGLHLFRARVDILDASGTTVGYFKSKLFSLGGGFFVFDTTDTQVAEIKGDWKGWNFSFLGTGGKLLGTVTKKWAGIGKELFTSADNYMIAIDDVSATRNTKILLIAAGLAIDIVYKEK